MVKAGKWLRNFLTGKKEKEKEKEKEKGRAQPSPEPTETQSAPVPVPTPKEKKRWSFRRSPAVGKDSNSSDPAASAPILGIPETDIGQSRHATAVVAPTAAAADAAVAAAQAATAVICLTSTTNRRTTSAIEEAAAIRIQAVFRSYLARKALCALRGLVKLQALVRGHLVRKQATATLRCMQALVTVQARTRAQRIRMIDEAQTNSQRQPIHRRSPQDHRLQQSYEMDRNAEEIVKIVEMDLGESRSNSKNRNSCSTPHAERNYDRFTAYYGSNHAPYKTNLQQFSPAPSGITDMSPRTCSGHFEEFSFTTAQSSPQVLSAVSISDSTPASFTASQQETTYFMSHDYPFYPNYMANTESSRAKARSQSAPKQRPDTFERQPSRRRPSVEGRNIPRGVKMQRSSSHVGSMTIGYQYPWYMKLDRSGTSIKDSECGSTSTVLTNNNYCKSLVAYEVHGSKQ